MPKVKRDRDGMPIPNKDGVTPDGNRYQYLSLPKNRLEDLGKCYFELELLEVGETDTGKYFFKFSILDTDTKMVGEASELLDPNQQYAETYFWKALFSMVAALRGKEPTAELFEKMLEDYKKVLQRCLDGKYNGKRARLDIEAYETKNGDKRTKKLWSVLE